MIMQPEIITEELYRRALEEVSKKKEIPVLSDLRFEGLDEGKAAQIMHIGPYDAEGPTIAKLHDCIKRNGYEKKENTMRYI